MLSKDEKSKESEFKNSIYPLEESNIRLSKKITHNKVIVNVFC